MPSAQSTEIARFLVRDLKSLRRELEAYSEEELIWSLPAGAPNSAGTLALHAAGNLQHYVGALLGGTDYVRDREAEFARRDVPRQELLNELAFAQETVVSVLPALDDSVLEAPFPEQMRGETIATSRALLQLSIHLAYHLGQIDYHRRLLSGDDRGVDAISPVAL